MNLTSLQSRFRGQLLTRESAGYDSARRIWNGMIDRKPLAIARCFQPDDVLEAARFAAEQDIYPAIRAGGHNVAGIAMIDDGLVIDVTGLKQMSSTFLLAKAIANSVAVAKMNGLTIIGSAAKFTHGSLPHFERETGPEALPVCCGWLGTTLHQ